MQGRITSFVRVADLYEDVARSALTCEWKDYEDAVQYLSAIREGADCIVTRNKSERNGTIDEDDG